MRSRTHKYIRNLNSAGTFKNILTEGSRNAGRDPVWSSWVREAANNAFAAERVELYQHRPAEELYDVVKDPYELKNVADDTQHNKVMGDLRETLDAWMAQQKDQGTATEMKAFERQG